MASSSESHGTHDLNAATNPMTLSKDELNVVEIEGLIDAYWGMAFMEGRQGRSVDTPEGSAQETRSAISRRLSEAATAIQTLQRERDALREALRPFAERAVGYEHLPAFETDARFQHLRRARLLLKEGGE